MNKDRIFIKMALQPVPIVLAIAWGLSHFISYPTLAQATRNTQRRPAQTLPPPPQTPPPNQRKPGGGLDASKSACKDTSKPLTALIPVQNPVLATSEHPTFLFYVPYRSDEVEVGEFSLLVWPDEKKRIYKTSFTLPQTPGIVSITLPSSPEYALVENQYYHWYVKLYCKGNTSNKPDLDLNGWVQRVALTPERERQIKDATPEVWYDALANLANRLSTSPQDATLRSKWVNLLKSIGSEDLAQEPFVGSVMPRER
ncbi:MAG TPA: hypothetical protein DDZ80_24055 [Cyanobacteria bacterium UBA8803]|nr:hypothetical protein [Cyanobacteria bacterium UBA9273]HBL61387.1 hypothetical protein [Cyanobacteria bacterium UBA8803]